ncbi:MAG: PAS domain-containing protein [Gammaproteobacteria bacterium]|nr:PAS domain-containing protein [Gammaproteobacteria bacterium]
MNDAARQQSSSVKPRVTIALQHEQQTRRADDKMWVDVIQRMENSYTDLVHYQLELEAKNAELENAQRFIESIISSISDVLIVCDINGNILQVNDALKTATGKSSVELAGTPLTALISDKNQTVIAEFPKRIRTASIIDCEIDLLSYNNDDVPMAVNCSARFDHNNNLSGFVITGRPLGELRKAYHELHQSHEDLKNAQQQLIQSEKLASLGRLVAGVAHELNNPISFLYANMHALRTYENKFKIYINSIHDGATNDEREKLRQELKIDNMMHDIEPLIEGSLEGAERVSDIVKNLRKFATPQAGHKQIFDLIPVIERATSWVIKASTGKPKIVSDYPECLEIYNSEGHIHQILINLIQNAIDAIADNKEPLLNIQIRIKNKMVAISIQDNGSGISEQDIVKIFDPFFTTKAAGHGTGLGLYISYGLATEQCSGNLMALSHHTKNKGAEFILSLPLEMTP